jgi:hypothetical protein
MGQCKLLVTILDGYQKKFPSAQINYIYANMIGKARHIFPNKIPDTIRVWTYEIHDSKKYKINLYSNSM